MHCHRRPTQAGSGPTFTGGGGSIRRVPGYAPRLCDDVAQRVEAQAVPEIAEPLAGGARRGEAGEQRVEHIGDTGDAEPLGDRLVEPGARESAADIKRIRSRDPPDDADIAGIGPGAAIGASGDADAEPLL